MNYMYYGYKIFILGRFYKQKKLNPRYSSFISGGLDGYDTVTATVAYSSSFKLLCHSRQAKSSNSIESCGATNVGQSAMVNG